MGSQRQEPQTTACFPWPAGGRPTAKRGTPAAVSGPSALQRGLPDAELAVVAAGEDGKVAGAAADVPHDAAPGRGRWRARQRLNRSP